ncbi:MAG TPA: excinuclease ABC subunit UvrA [Bryobacteraceae bacterium]|nr:excinuclease ABC subunit UvrA [Bryobacteraceae bacterium]
MTQPNHLRSSATDSRPSAPGDSIRIRGARVHNLKNISVDLPHDQLIVVTGVSGSGKSSLAFDTVYAEGQRRYVESLSAYARQFLERMEKPDVDEIDGIAPPVAIRQKNTTRNPRSTVATSTELYDFLRLLWARAGRTYCPNCGTHVERESVDQVAAKMLQQPEGSRWYALFPLPKEPDTEKLRDRLFDLRKRGFNRLYQSGQVFEFSTPESLLDVDFNKPVFILADRLAISPGSRQRLVDTVEICYKESGEVYFEPAGGGPAIRFNEKFACKTCGKEFAEPEPGLFSFNSPVGACKRCQGFGNTIDYDMDLVIPNRALSIQQGAVDPWTKPQHSWYLEEFRKAAKNQVRLNVPVMTLTQRERDILFSHIRAYFKEVEAKKYKVHVRVFMSRYRGYTLCPDCGGSRLRAEALWIRVGDKNLGDVSRMNIAQAAEFFNSLKLTPEESQIADKVLVEIRQRLKFLNDVGLEYLTLDRLSATLSGGEAQRIQLATCLGSRLVGACYVLDEPSIGLHSRDTARLIGILKDLRDLGNTILVVEHDPDVMRSSDHILDLGPGAGEHGGRVVFQGSFEQLERDGTSLTAKYLRGELKTSHLTHRRKAHAKQTLRFFGAQAHNLKGIDVAIPLHMMVAVTGVSGSGKSTLVHDVIYQSLAKRLQSPTLPTAADADVSGWDAGPEKLVCTKVEKADLLTSVVLVDQSPIGRTPRSNPVTYIKAFDLIRELFASTPDAKRRGYTAGHFSFNIPGGRCETCQGDGTVTVEMQFLADVELVCEDCKGTRYKPSVLEVQYKTLNIHEVLQLAVQEAISFFSSTPRLADKLRVLADVGLGYLRLGQSATTLSGGEAQRVKLAAHLAQATSEGTLYIFDEPTTGLHFDDIAKLLDAFERLLRAGASIVIIEHNLEVIRRADWVIDLGPEGGDAGGYIVAEGTPEHIATVKESYTGRYLRAQA